MSCSFLLRFLTKFTHELSSLQRTIVIDPSAAAVLPGVWPKIPLFKSSSQRFLFLLETLNREIAVGLEQANRGECAEFDFDELMQEVDEELGYTDIKS